ncbi:MAG: isoprenylcysteine carboxylmethyltransferase family protein [Chloroflexi bacterium]|nr:isoprenylcysteine carboxylmethyltransferase family protein [Chloroflexota bacterium]
MTSRDLGRLAWAAFALAVLFLAGSFAYAYVFGDAAVQAERVDRPWYGNWGLVVFAVLFFSAFVLAFLRSPRRREWRHLGLAEAYLVALFAEMFGLPLTIYLVGSVLGVNLGLGGLEGHLWAVLLDRLGFVPLAQGVALVMAISSVLIVFGLALMAAGWWQVWRAKGELVTTGLYRFVRHPQYIGFLLVIVGFLIQWPTLPTLALFPFLVVMYVRLARREERELAAHFGERWTAYAARTPMLFPGWSRTGR